MPGRFTAGPHLWRLLDGEKSGEGELSILTTAGAPLPISFSFNSLSTDGEELLILIIRDLSARKRLEAENEEIQRQLFQSSKLASLGELSAGVAHEINNPLNGIINFAQLLKDEPAERSDFERQMIDGIIEEGERIAQIVRGLLTFARSDQQELRRVRVEDAIKTSVALFGRQLEKDGIRVEVDLDPDLPPVRADGSRLRQVVVNLISNAHYALQAKAAALASGRCSASRRGASVRPARPSCARSSTTTASASGVRTWAKSSTRSLRPAAKPAERASA